MKLVKIALLCLLQPFGAGAQLQLAKVFSSNMVLQRNKPVSIWGQAVPGGVVQVKFDGENVNAIVRKDGFWQVILPRKPANCHPQRMIVSSGPDTLILQNILLGDVWICSGQSNMEWPMVKEMHWTTEARHSFQPLMRFTNPPPAGRNVFGVAYTDSLKRRLNAQDFYQWGQWQVSDSNSIKNMSAVAYYFAKFILQHEAIPIGLINLSIGGAPIETFISSDALEASSDFGNKVKGNWLKNSNLPAWIRQRAIENVGNGNSFYADEHGINHAYKPSFAFEAGIQSLLLMPVMGVIWYQGESNSLELERVAEYAALQKLLIADYRKKWHQEDLFFYWVQLSSIDTARYASQFWPQFRDEQRRLWPQVPNSGFAVTSDIGFKNNVHPTNKKLVGERLARWALKQVYGKNITPSGPLPLKAVYKRNSLFVTFRYNKGLHTSDGKALRGFSLNNGVDVAAFIKKNRVIIPVEKKPVFIYYGWKPYTDANLVNAEELPASTFKIKVQ